MVEDGRQPIIEAALWIAENIPDRIACLWGPTAVGKSYAVTEIGRRRESKVITILASQSTPDELCGYQVIRDGQLHVGFPWWWREAEEFFCSNPSGEAVLFLDEVGQARHETRAVLYTFLRNRTLYGSKLSGRVLVFAATNAARFSAAWRSRMCFLHFPPSEAQLKAIARGYWLAELAVQHGAAFISVGDASDPELSDEPPPPPETLDASAVAALTSADASFFQLSAEAQSLILHALLPPAVAEIVRRQLKDRGSIEAIALLRDPVRLEGTVRELETPRAVTLAMSVLYAAARCPDDQIVADALLAILDALMADADKLRAYYELEKPNLVIDRIAALPARLVADAIVSSGRLQLGGMSMSGSWVEALTAQGQQKTLRLDFDVA